MEYIHLMGSEQVQSAANTMRQAAADMQRAAENMDYALVQHRNFMDDWLIRYETIVGQLILSGNN